MTKYKIPISKPYISKYDVQSVRECVKSTWISSKSPIVNKFEKEFSNKISGTKYTISTNSCTSALFLALKSLGIGKGDQVIIPTFTMIATINAVEWSGATPVLADSKSMSDWNISTKEIKKIITNKTKAIIPVHIYGYPCDMREISQIAKKYNLRVVEDSAEAVGSNYMGKDYCSYSDIACFSLYANKIITTGNGGLLCTNNKNIYSFVKKISFFGFDKDEHFNHKIIGYNLVLSGIQASLGLSQILNFEKLLSKRISDYKTYKKYLENNNRIIFIKPQNISHPNYWFPAILFKKIKNKNYIQKILDKNHIETRSFFKPVHMQVAYRNYFKNKYFPNSEYFFKRGLLLPSFYDLKKKDIKYITDIINDSLKK